MMNCQRCQDQVFEYLDGSLSDSARAAVEAHLEHCAACRQTVQAHQALVARFRQETEFLMLRPGLLNRVMSAAEEPMAPRFASVFRAPLAWAAAIAAVLLVAAGLSFRRPSRTNVQRSESTPTPALSSISIRFSSCDPTYTFRREKNVVIDALTCTPRVVEENLSLSLNQKQNLQLQERKTPL